MYTQDQSSDDESSITRSEDTDTPEPKSVEKNSEEESKKEIFDVKEDGVVLKLKELKVDGEKTE